MIFRLPALLQAERAGRLAARKLCDKTSVEVRAGGTLAGAAALAAARHLLNLGQQVVIYPEANGVDDCPEAECMLRVLTQMHASIAPADAVKCDVLLDGSATADLPVEDNASVIDARCFLNAEPDLLWDDYCPQHPFVRQTSASEARSAAAVRAIDQEAILTYGLPGICLMENAGIAATALAYDWLSPSRRLPILPESAHGSGPAIIVVGYGNNGGDGLVVARGLLEKLCKVRVLLLGDPARLKGDAGANLSLLMQQADVVEQAPQSMGAWLEILRQAPLIVDGIFGTGLSRPAEGAAALAIDAINRSERRVLALDLPSGLHADTGETLGHAVCADATITFAAPKTGLYQGEGSRLCGELLLGDIGCPRKLLENTTHDKHD